MEIKVIAKALEQIAPYENNARQHDDEQIACIMSSIRQFGFTNPILISDGIIVAGHGRYEAASRLYAAGEVIKLPNGKKLPVGVIPAIDCSGWTDEQRRAYTLADNRLAEKATWDDDLLKFELSFLDDSDFDCSSIGFSLPDLDKLLGAPEDVDDPAAEWQGMPEFKQEDKRAYRTILVHFNDEENVQAFAKLVEQKITGKTKFIWFPQIEIEHSVDKRYSSDAA